MEKQNTTPKDYAELLIKIYRHNRENYYKKNKEIKHEVIKAKPAKKQKFDKQWVIKNINEIQDTLKKFGLYENLNTTELYSKYLTQKNKHTRVFEIVTDLFNSKLNPARIVLLD